MEKGDSDVETLNKEVSKKIYQTPELTIYGPIRTLTQLNPSGLGSHDNGNPVNPGKT
jgi:hypothetical protein